MNLFQAPALNLHGVLQSIISLFKASGSVPMSLMPEGRPLNIISAANYERLHVVGEDVCEVGLTEASSFRPMELSPNEREASVRELRNAIHFARQTP